MPDRELIHSSADVVALLTYALDCQFQVIADIPQMEARPKTLLPQDVPEAKAGNFYLLRPEWIYGPFQTMVISDGHNRGKYFVQPRVNFSTITVFFHGERIDQGRRRFGSGVVSYHRDWLEFPGKVVRPTPDDVGVWFKRIVAHLSSGVVLKADAHRYHVCKGVMADPNAEKTLPPFDFIPWSSEILHSYNHKR